MMMRRRRKRRTARNSDSMRSSEWQAAPKHRSSHDRAPPTCQLAEDSRAPPLISKVFSGKSHSEKSISETHRDSPVDSSVSFGVLPNSSGETHRWCLRMYRGMAVSHPELTDEFPETHRGEFPKLIAKLTGRFSEVFVKKSEILKEICRAEVC
eukprot:5745032-Pyramimonas_sp.AAC.1